MSQTKAVQLLKDFGGKMEKVMILLKIDGKPKEIKRMANVH